MFAEHRLRYNAPCTTFPSSLPLGNGRLAASVLSSPHEESFILNDVSFWSGAQHIAGSGLASTSRDPKAELRQTQGYLLQGDFAQAKERSEKYLESKKHNFGTNLGVGKLHVEVIDQEDGVDSCQNFARELRLDEAIAETTYEKNGFWFKRRSFLSNPHQVLIVQFQSNHPEGLKLVVSVRGESSAFSVAVKDNRRLSFFTQALEKVHSDGISGVRGCGQVVARVDEGGVEYKEGRIFATGKHSITIFLSFNTDYNQTGDIWKDEALERISTASELSVDELLKAHLADHQPLYGRTSLSLGSTDSSTTHGPTDKRRERFEASGYADPGLFALYFHYARYLTISGTRATSPLPLHLQGLWNDGEACQMGWSCDYHLDINTQMNYFAILPSGLPELMEPLILYLQTLAKAGRDAARVCYGCEGWVAHIFSNVWGFADPGWETSYGLNVTGGLWMASHLIELYEYTFDDEFLARTAYPLLKGAAEFFLDYMIEDPKTGWLHTGPSVSPENSFFITGKEGKEEHQLSLSPTLDIVLLRDLFTFCGFATNRLNIDFTFAEKVESARAKLPPFQVGKHGQLQEWIEDYEEAQPYHRHLSHTMALCRSSQISLRHTPQLAEAVRVTLDRRQGRDDLEDIEFTAALFGLNYARLNDSENAVAQLGHLVSELSFDNLLSYSKPGVAGAETNIFVADGNYGGAAVISEMLMRSVIPKLGGPVEIELLPALPKTWPEGTCKGFHLRGNLTADMQWISGKLVHATFKASSIGYLVVYYQHYKYEARYTVGTIIKLGPTLLSLN